MAAANLIEEVGLVINGTVLSDRYIYSRYCGLVLNEAHSSDIVLEEVETCLKADFFRPRLCLCRETLLPRLTLV